MLQPVEALIGDTNQQVGLIAVLGKRGDAVVHADAYTHLKGHDRFFENGSDAAAQRQGLSRIGLWKEKREFIAADAKGGVRSAQRFFEGRCSGTQNFIAARMAVLVVDFLEAVQIENDQAERRAVTTSAINLLFESFAEEAPVVQAR